MNHLSLTSYLEITSSNPSNTVFFTLVTMKTVALLSILKHGHVCEFVNSQVSRESRELHV